jgi:hypothetical protein
MTVASCNNSGSGSSNSKDCYGCGIFAPRYICTLYLKYIFNIFKNIKIYNKIFILIKIYLVYILICCCIMIQIHSKRRLTSDERNETRRR